MLTEINILNVLSWLTTVEQDSIQLVLKAK